MRFILKCAFWLGLLAFFLPFGSERETSGTEISWLGAVAGVQEAVQDLSGFCDRAPRACQTGREAAVFAGERIGDGLAIAYGFIDDRRAPADGSPATDIASAIAAGGELSTDPVTTGTLSAASDPPLPRAYIAPRRAASEASSLASAVAVVPTPAPRF